MVIQIVGKVFCLLHSIGYVRAAFIKGPAIVGDDQTMFCTAEQPYANTVFKVPDLAADGGGGLSETSCCCGKALCFDDPRKQYHLTWKIQFSRPYFANSAHPF